MGTSSDHQDRESNRSEAETAETMALTSSSSSSSSSTSDARSSRASSVVANAWFKCRKLCRKNNLQIKAVYRRKTFLVCGKIRCEIVVADMCLLFMIYHRTSMIWCIKKERKEQKCSDANAHDFLSKKSSLKRRKEEETANILEAKTKKQEEAYYQNRKRLKKRGQKSYVSKISSSFRKFLYQTDIDMEGYVKRSSSCAREEWVT